MSQYRNRGSHPVDLADGRILAPGETADIKASDPHHRALIAAGLLRPVPVKRPRKKPTPARPPELSQPSTPTQED